MLLYVSLKPPLNLCCAIVRVKVVKPGGAKRAKNAQGMFKANNNKSYKIHFRREQNLNECCPNEVVRGKRLPWAPLRAVFRHTERRRLLMFVDSDPKKGWCVGNAR